jgi:hypothetical protein
MALDISGGFILKGAKTLDAAYHRLPGWLEASYIRARQLSQQAIVSLATDFYDEATAVGKKDYRDLSDTPYDAAYNWINYELRETEEPAYNLGMALAIGVVNKRVIGLLHSDSKVMREFFMAQPDIGPYDYSVVSGKPKKVTSKQWEQRGNDWAALEINDQYVHMLEYTIIPPRTLFIPSRDDSVILPSFEARLQKLAHQHTMYECRDEFGLYSNQKCLEFIMRNPIYTERLTKTARYLETALDKDLTLEKLQKET